MAKDVTSYYSLNYQCFVVGIYDYMFIVTIKGNWKRDRSKITSNSEYLMNGLSNRMSVSHFITRYIFNNIGEFNYSNFLNQGRKLWVLVGIDFCSPSLVLLNNPRPLVGKLVFFLCLFLVNVSVDFAAWSILILHNTHLYYDPYNDESFKILPSNP